LVWGSAAAGAGLFADLMYHFARHGVWSFGTGWVWFVALSAIASLMIYIRRWGVNERFYESSRA
jgi:Na+-transporting NADH:ubiquinone oxidoreductase subunit NqrE